MFLNFYGYLNISLKHFLSVLISFLNYFTFWRVCLLISIVPFYFFLFLYFLFDKNFEAFQFVLNFSNFFFSFSTIDDIFFYFHLNVSYLTKNIFIIFGFDGISLPLVLLTCFIFPICFQLVISYNSKNTRVFIIFILILLQFFLVFVFSVLDLFFFYIFFESTLIPMFVLIGKAGSRFRKIKASYYLFFYTFSGSIFMFLGLLSLFFSIGTTSFFDASFFLFSIEHQKFLWFCLFITFAVKIPIMPFHIWLPEAHVEAPTIGSIILASILLKLGLYGFFRFSIPLFPFGTFFFLPFVITLCLSSVLYASFVTIRQIDMKRIIAYSSIAHMNMAVLGLFSLNLYGLLGSFYLMLGHGLISGALFFNIGILYDRYHTRILFYLGGLTSVMPIFSFFFLFFSFSNVGFPGTFNFISEFFVLKGLIFFNGFVVFFVSFGIILSIVYSILLYNRVMFGTLKIIFINYFSDLNFKEFLISFLFFFFIFFFGINTNFLLNTCFISIYGIL